MSTTISPEIETMIQSFLGSGEYTDANEVLRDALLLLREREEFPEWSIDALRKEIEIAREEVRNGQFGHQTVREIAEEVRQEHGKRNGML